MMQRNQLFCTLLLICCVSICCQTSSDPYCLEQGENTTCQFPCGCINQSHMHCMKDYLMDNKENIKYLRRVFFQPNMPIPRYVILHYFYAKNGSKQCPEIDQLDCCKDKWNEEACNGRNHSWIWTRSSIYLFLYPSALDYFSFQNFSYHFTAIPRINQACVCLPEVCEDIENKTDNFEEQFTSEVYRQLSKPDSYDPSDNLDGNFMKFYSEYVILGKEEDQTDNNGRKVTPILILRTRYLMAVALVFYGFITFPLICITIVKLFQVASKEGNWKSVVYWTYSWSTALATVTTLGWLLYTDTLFAQNFIVDFEKARNKWTPVYKLIFAIMCCIYIVFPGLGFGIVAFLTKKEPKLPLIFPLNCLIWLLKRVHIKAANLASNFIQGCILWSMLMLSQLIIYRLMMVFFAAFSGPLIVWGNFVFVISLWFLATFALAFGLIILQAIAYTIRKMRPKAIKAYSSPLMFSTAAFIVMAAVTEVTYIVTGLGYYEKHSFSDSFQTIVDFIAQAIIIGIVGYMIRVVLGKVDQFTAEKLNMQTPFQDDYEDDIHVENTHDRALIIPVFGPHRRRNTTVRNYGSINNDN